MSKTLSLVVAGAGLIGRRHVQTIGNVDGVRVAAIVDPTMQSKEYAQELGVPWFAELSQYLQRQKPDGAIIATPNQMHVDNGLECVAAGVPTLVEKPIASDAKSAEELVAAAQVAKVPLLVGHHRRHNPLIQRAHQTLSEGKIGNIVVVHAMCWFFKPDEYFNTKWRKEPGAGPVFINLIHDIDLLRHLCGEIIWVQALESNAIRGNDVEETCVVLLRFDNGALGTVTVSDSVVSPWSWELTANENPAYHPTGQSCYLIGGTNGSLELPDNRVWKNPDQRSWMEPVLPNENPTELEDPLVRQIRHFCEVIRGNEPPLVSGLEGLKTLRVIEAVKQSASNAGTGVAIYESN